MALNKRTLPRRRRELRLLKNCFGPLCAMQLNYREAARQLRPPGDMWSDVPHGP